MASKTIAEERHIFRCIEQSPHQSMETFVNQLKQQVTKCGFRENEIQDRLKEQIIEKCFNPQLREIALKMEITVDQLITTGTILEKEKESGSQNKCRRCGFSDHKESDPNCPAKRKKVFCSNCDKFGHYKRMCKFEKKERSVTFADAYEGRPLAKNKNENGILKRKWEVSAHSGIKAEVKDCATTSDERSGEASNAAIKISRNQLKPEKIIKLK